MPLENGAGGTAPPDINSILAGLNNQQQRNNQPMVYLGQAGRYNGSMMEKYDWRVSLDEAVAEIYNWQDDERAQWGKRLYGAGLLDDPNDWNGMQEAWEYAVKQTAGFNAGGKPKMTPWSFIDLLEQRGAGKDALDARRRQAANEARALMPSRSTSTSYNALPTKEDAHVAIKTLFQEQLGRDPEDGELDRYTSMMLSKMKANPGKTVSTSISDPRTNTTTSTSRTTAGFNPSGMLEKEAKGDPEWGAYQAATTYFNALQGAIGAPG